MHFGHAHCRVEGGQEDTLSWTEKYTKPAHASEHVSAVYDRPISWGRSLVGLSMKHPTYFNSLSARPSSWHRSAAGVVVVDTGMVDPAARDVAAAVLPAAGFKVDSTSSTICDEAC